MFCNIKHYSPQGREECKGKKKEKFNHGFSQIGAEDKSEKKKQEAT
ncbi:MAG: hypothetical protein ACE5KZ_16695 [Candidatus Scalinduaceae bacterium]